MTYQTVTRGLMLVVLAGGAGAVAGCESNCPYGSGVGSACKSRPDPDARERAAVLDGSAVMNAVAAFRRTKDAGRRVLGVGTNRWGETTFSLPTGETAFGEARERYVTFDRGGAALSQANAAQRGYLLVAGNDRFAITAVRPAALGRALRRGGRDAGARFDRAELSTSAFGRDGLAWELVYVAKGGAARLTMDPDGSRLCGAPPRTLRGVRAC